MSSRPFVINYDPQNGDAIADGKVMSRALALAARLKTISRTGSETVASELYVTAVRVLIVQGKIDPKSVLFRFNGEIVPMVTDPQSPSVGRFQSLPKGFCDHAETLLMALI